VRAGSAHKSIPVSATATGTTPISQGDHNAARGDDSVEEGAAVSPLWQDSLRSAGIVPDGRKYFADERAPEFGDNSFSE
jgi:hypothetical protein